MGMCPKGLRSWFSWRGFPSNTPTKHSSRFSNLDRQQSLTATNWYPTLLSPATSTRCPGLGLWFEEMIATRQKARKWHAQIDYTRTCTCRGSLFCLSFWDWFKYVSLAVVLDVGQPNLQQKNGGIGINVNTFSEVAKMGESAPLLWSFVVVWSQKVSYRPVISYSISILLCLHVLFRTSEPIRTIVIFRPAGTSCCRATTICGYKAMW